MTDLFDYAASLPKYPEHPGFKEIGTPLDAAVAIKSRSQPLRRRALAVICTRPSTPDEVADVLGETVLAIRPRITELKRFGLIEKTGEKRANASGCDAYVWRIKGKP